MLLDVGGLWGSLYVVLEWTIRLVMLVVVPFRRSPEAAKGWLLLVFFLPVPGLLLYLAIGRPTYPRWRRKRFLRLPQLLQAATKELTHSRNCRSPDLPANLAQAAALIERLGQFPTLAGNTLAILTDYAGIVDQLVADIDGAQDHVHLLVYIFANDRTGRQVADALIRAARRGVTCRVLVDAIGSRGSARSVVKRMQSEGVAVGVMLPVGFLGRGSARADLRNHRKIVVIDSSIGYVGSQNVVDAELRPGAANEELVARVTGPVVLELQAIFVADWFLETEELLDIPRLFEHRHPGDGSIAQVLPSGPNYPAAGVGRMLTALVHGAGERVVITTPYFIPDEALLQALETAVLRGVEVHVILPRLSDHWLASLAQRSYYTELMQAGIHIHLYRDRFLHAKHVSIDGQIALIGSSNVDIRSFVLNAEVSLLIYDPAAVARLGEEQERYFARSDGASLRDWEKRSLIVKTAENLARLMSPLL